MWPMTGDARVQGPSRPGGLLRGALGPHTWRAALYLLLALPTSLLVTLTLLLAVFSGLLTLPLLVGAGLLLGTLWLVGALGDVQRALARVLGVRFAAPPLRSFPGLLPWVRAQLADPVTYRTLLFHAVQLPLALACWVVLAPLLALSVLGISAPLWLRWGTPPVVWGEWTLTPEPGAWPGLLLLGLGAGLVTVGVLDLMGRMWTRLCAALLVRDPAAEATRREVVALRRAAGRVALGDDLPTTLADLTEQALAASTARSVTLLDAEGTLRAGSGPDVPGAGAPPAEQPATARPAGSPGPGAADMRPQPDGTLLVTLPITLPASAGTPHGTLRALYAPGVRPGGEELAFLLSIADHAGTALHAAQLIQRAGERAGEQERARLARELHDSVAQALYGISLGAKTARATLNDPERARASLDYTIRLAEGGVSEMKALLFSLRPDALEEGGLVAALTGHARALEARHGLQVHAQLNEEPHLTPEAQAAAYRVAQEALHNVVKHARATQVWIGLETRPNDAGETEVRLSVRDDGRGFDPARLPGGTLGQRSMRERALGVGGRLTVHSRPGEGTRVELHLPAAPGQA